MVREAARYARDCTHRRLALRHQDHSTGCAAGAVGLADALLELVCDKTDLGEITAARGVALRSVRSEHVDMSFKWLQKINNDKKINVRKAKGQCNYSELLKWFTAERLTATLCRLLVCGQPRQPGGPTGPAGHGPTDPLTQSVSP